ncbi:ArsR/SmtB family transcription factor [Thalassospira marina]|uniref:Transcriptional regulator n=1 Tax=Thalassospira marina TaxID=2048283 RepID=A0A2N3KXT2_9PROT|nr:helix-turn-helix domain-containing protein [Thalassospira marina]PKR55379.1 transcriptional regulator [Thalassospira marina]
MHDAQTLLSQLQALSHPVRLWVVAMLAREGELYVSHLAREAGISRPLMKMHLKKLELAGLVCCETGLAENGKAANFYRVMPFALTLTPETIAQADPDASLAPHQGDRDD